MRKRMPFLAFLLLYLAYALFTHKDFGITWDEGDVYSRGYRLYQSLLTGDNHKLLQRDGPENPDGDVFYNHAYACLLYLFNKEFSLERFHLLNMVFAALIFWAAYELLFFQYRDSRLALLGPAFLVLNPRFFGDIPANPKDMPFAVFYFLALSLLVLLKPGWKRAALLGLVLGFAQSSRVLGFTLYLFVAAYAFYESRVLKTRPRKPSRWVPPFLGELGAILAVSLSFMAATWPYLRQDFVRNLWELANLSAHFPYNSPVLFQGQATPAQDLPWFYMPLWLGIALPLSLLLPAALSFLLARGQKPNPVFSLFAAAFLFNATLILAAQPALYDGLRHFLYLLPMVSLLAAIGVIEILHRVREPRKRAWILAPLGLHLGGVALSLLGLHPYPYLYFNETVGGLRGAGGRFETDYWGAAYREAALWLRNSEIPHRKGRVLVHTKGNALQSVYYMDPDNTGWGTLEEADYYVSSTRWNEHLWVDQEKLIHSVSRDGLPLACVYKLR